MTWNKLSTYKTSVTQSGGDLAVTYHGTKIVQRLRAAGRVVIHLDTAGIAGGWSSSPITVGSATTKRKMNQASHQYGLGFSVHQHRHRWYVTTKAGRYEFAEPTFAFDADTGLPWGVVEIFTNDIGE